VRYRAAGPLVILKPLLYDIATFNFWIV
jgi:hypothetical protein